MNLYFKITNDWVQPDVDTQTEKSFALNYTFDSLENPTDYISTYSFDFQLPKTERNNKLFGMFGEVQSSETFPPNKLIEYMYIGGGNTVSRGECYITEITEEYYVVAMNGSLYTVFSKLLNSGWNKKKSESDDEYYLLPEIWKNISYSPTTLKNNWEFNVNTNPFSWETVKEYPFQLQRFNYVAGFAPTQPNDDSFKSDKLKDETGNVTDIPEETNAHQMAEWKISDTSLYPYIYVLRLWQVFKEHCKNITDYSMELDDRWYNNDYEFLHNLVYLLPPISNESDSDDENNDIYQVKETLEDFTTESLEFVGNKYSGQLVKFGYVIPMKFDLNRPQVQLYNNKPEDCVWNFSMDYGLVVDFSVKDDNGNTLHSLKRCYVFLNDKKRQNGQYQYELSPIRESQLRQLVDEVVVVRYTSGANVNGYKDENGITRYVYQFPSVSYDITLKNVQNVHAETDIHWINWTSISTTVYNRLFRPYNPARDRWQYPEIQPEGWYDTYVALTSANVNSVVDSQKLTLDKMFKDVSPFSVLIKYCKMLGMVISVDDNNKVIKVLRRSDFIWDCFHKDMSSNDNAVNPYTGYWDINQITDFEKYSIKPLAWATRNVMLGYSETNDEYAENYIEKYGQSYGSLKIITQNRINNDTEELMNTNEYNNINPTIVTSENVLPYIHLLMNNQQQILDTDEFLRPISNCFAFRLSNSTWNREIRNNWRVDSNGVYVLISTKYQGNTIEEDDCWHTDNYQNDMITYSRPVFSDVSNYYSILFGKPQEVYNSRNYDEYNYLFNLEWYNYVEEVYNIQNKTIKVKCYLESDDYDRMSRCPFVTLVGLGYFVTSISGWSEYNKLCSVELRQIDSLAYLQNPSKSYTDEQPLRDEGYNINTPIDKRKRFAPADDDIL